MKKRLKVVALMMVLALSMFACGKKTVSVELTAVGDMKVNMVKTVMEITGLNIKDAKAIVDNAPSIVVEDVTKEEAEEIKEKLEAVSGTVTIKE